MVHTRTPPPPRPPPPLWTTSLSLSFHSDWDAEGVQPANRHSCALPACVLPRNSPMEGHQEGSRWLSLPASAHGTLSSQSHVPESLGAAPPQRSSHPSIPPSWRTLAFPVGPWACTPQLVVPRCTAACGHRRLLAAVYTVRDVSGGTPHLPPACPSPAPWFRGVVP